MEDKPAPIIITPFLTENKIDKLEISLNVILVISNDGHFMKLRTEVSNNFTRNIYELIVSLNKLKEINDYFKLFKDLNSVQNSLINEYKNKRIAFNINEKEIKMVITNLILNSKFEISIPNIESIPDTKEIYKVFKEMDKRIKYLENENNILKKQIQENKEKINFLENNLKISNNNNNYNKTSYNTIKITTPSPKNSLKFFFDSQIIKNREDENLLINFLEKKPKNIILLFNSVIHGDTIQNFHLKVSDKTPTYIIIKTDKQRILGGFTTHIWNENNNGIFKDSEAFVFSLDNRKKYKVKNINNAIVDKKTHIQFGTCCFRINTNSTKINNLEENLDYETYGFCLSGENYFLVKSYEVFFIEF